MVEVCAGAAEDDIIDACLRETLLLPILLVWPSEVGVTLLSKNVGVQLENKQYVQLRVEMTLPNFFFLIWSEGARLGLAAASDLACNH